MAQVHPHPHGRALPQKLPSLLENKGWDQDDDLQAKVKQHAAEANSFKATLALAWGSLGVIYGDIGTSPMYVLSSIFPAEISPTVDDIKGGMSLIFWTITLIVVVKYVLVVMRADDDGQGGTFALYSLLCRTIGVSPRGNVSSRNLQHITALNPAASARHLDVRSHGGGGGKGYQKAAADLVNGWCYSPKLAARMRDTFRGHGRLQLALLLTCVVATAMVMGDGVLTPAISVMSAISGLKVAASVTNDMVVGISIAILIVLFMAQSYGTAKIGHAFAPIIFVWFITNALIGCYNMHTYGGGSIFEALSPGYIVTLFSRHGAAAWEMLGGVMLSITGAEAMFADLGHFNLPAVSYSCLILVYPSLILTYLGQAAYLTVHPKDIAETYWASVPSSVFWPMLVVALLASVVASQALITGCFSIIRQAMSLGLFPSVKIVHTDKSVEGQIYIGAVNYSLMMLCIAAVAGFRDTASLGNAYGVSVMTVMVLTTGFVTLVMLMTWELSPLLVAPFFLFFFTLEGVFLSATLSKVPKGGWFALAIATGVAIIKLIWWAGVSKKRQLLDKRGIVLDELFESGPISKFEVSNSHGGGKDGAGSRAAARQLTLRSAMHHVAVARPPGLGIYYSSSSIGMSSDLTSFVTKVHAIHEVVVLLTVRFVPMPSVEPEERLLVYAHLNFPNFYQVIARYGYMDQVDHSQRFLGQLIATIEFKLKNSAGKQPAVGPRRKRPSMARLSASFEGANSNSNSNLPGSLSDSNGARRVSADIHVRAGSGASDGSQAATNGDSNGAHVIRMPPGPSGEGAEGEDGADGGAQRHDFRRRPTQVELGDVVSSLDKQATSLSNLDADVAEAISSAKYYRSAEDIDEAIDTLVNASAVGVAYYMGRIRMRPSATCGWFTRTLYDSLYNALERNSTNDTDTFQIPASELVEHGMVLELS